MHLRFIITFFIMLGFGSMLWAQNVEICNNGIDDDNDGLVDLNDDDCNCDSVLPSPLIPNESFEDMECCPTGEADFQCATAWEQASAATSDYYHTCGITSPTWIGHLPPDTPIPDGQGYVGFRDGRANNPQYKEYVGACLTEQMEVGKVYRLDFFLGFPRGNVGFDHIDMTIYGTTECSNIPFGNGNAFIGCPTNTPGWTQMDQQFVSGNNEWVNVVFDLTADKPYSAIVLGPSCEDHPDFTSEPYFFVDRLRLLEQVDVLLPYAEIDGSVCESDIRLEAEEGENFTYQWYKDGVAIIDQTSIDINLEVNAFNEGIYSVLIGTPEGCFISEDFNLELPTLESSLDTVICSNETYEFAGQELNTADTYMATFTSVQGCDSVVTLNLEVIDAPTRNIEETLCDGSGYTLDGVTYTEEDLYLITKPSEQGCDSLIILDLTIESSPIIEQNIEVCDNIPLVIDGQNIDQTGMYTFNYDLPSGCDSTVILNATIHPTYTLSTSESICEGESYLFGTEVLTESNIYTRTLTSSRGCDSTVTLDLQVIPATSSSLFETICENESFAVGDTSFSSPGQYTYTTINQAGCDSIVELSLDLRIWNDGVSLPNDTTVEMGSALDISPIFIDPLFGQVVWTDEDANVLSNETTLSLMEIIFPQTINILAVDEHGCIDEDQIKIRVDRNIGIYTPNIFSPNGDGNNDFFRPIANPSITSLKDISIYDRWGNQVYYEENVTDLINWLGWNGDIKGGKAITGVYVYVATFISLDGQEELVSGDVTLIR